MSRLAIAALVGAVAVGAPLGWLVIDGAAERQDLAVGIEHREGTLQLMEALVLSAHRDTGADSLAREVHRLVPDRIVKRTGEGVDCGDVVFVYEGARLARLDW